MRKSAVFLSVVLTAFVITLLVGALYAYRNVSFADPFAPVQGQAMSQATSTDAPTTAPSVAPTQLVALAGSVTPQQAAAIAAKSLDRTDLYSVQLAAINGLNLYKVTFVSGDVVYVSMDGQVILTVPAPPTPPAPTPVPAVAGAVGGGGGGHHSGGGGGGGGDDGGGD
jgi:uncharacterized membrane protein YgcG